MAGPDDVICPDCGAPMVLRETRRLTYHNGDPRKFYGCSNWPECSGVHGAHPDGTPMGIPANKETRQARKEAHQAFDAYWLGRGWGRDEAYNWLAWKLDIDGDDCHIAMFDLATCKRVIEICTEGEVV